MFNYPISNCALILSKTNHNKFVAVYRKEAPTKICLPGGKLDPNENVLEAVTREIYEETGLIVLESELQPIYVGICEGTKEYLTTAFLVFVDDDIKLQSMEPEMKPFWTDIDYFNEHNSFPIFNANIFEAMKKVLKK